MSCDLEQARRAEHQKYELTYALHTYGMKVGRLEDATHDLARLPVRGPYLDVACGHGDVLRAARRLGFAPIRGTEIVAKLIDGRKVVYAEAHSLPFEDKSFAVVSMFDTIEHLLPGDDELACRELRRVAQHHVLLSANNMPSVHHGEELHINKRPHEEWHLLFARWFDTPRVTRLGDRRDTGPYASSWWRVDL